LTYDASFGQWLTLRRESLHLHRGELATRVGCAAITLRKIEADERRPSRELAEQLANHLAIPPHERELFIRVARGELPVDRLALARPNAGSPTNFAISATTLVGREREIEDVGALLSRADVRLLTLTGAPGVGKTRLALHAAFALRGAFRDGAFLIDLAPLSDPHLVLDAIAHALHVATTGGLSLVERLGHYLRVKQILLVLDNFEHVVDAAPQLRQLLAAAPQLKLLVTSRVALELSGEHRFSVLPLFVPPAAGNVRLLPVTEAQARYPAVDLFVQRARAVRPTFALTSANMAAVGEICRRIDGLPLAIELAAARIDLFTPQELLARLDDRFALLTSHVRDLPARHLTLRYAIDWSYSQLSLADQQLFRRLGVFVGGCTIEAAQAVCNSDGAMGSDVVDGIARLVASSLLQRRESYDGRSRFELIETLREYALGQLVASGETETIRRRHTAYYLQLAEATARVWDQPDEPAWLRRLVSVRDNLRAALRWALDSGDAVTVLRLNAALFSFWTTCSPLSEARDWLETALALPYPSTDRTLVLAHARVLNAAGYTAATTFDFMQAYAYFERGLALYRTLEDTRGIAWSLRGCAFVQMLRDAYAVAEEQINESLRMCHATGDDWGTAWSLYALAFLRLAEGDLVHARPALEDALVHLRQRGMPFGVFRTLLALGYVRFEQGDVAGAEALYREGLALSQEMPLLAFVTIGLDGQAMVAAAMGQPRRAARLWGATEALREVLSADRWHVFQRDYDRMIAAARTAVSTVEWEAAWAAGRTLTVAQAVAEALE